MDGGYSAVEYTACTTFLLSDSIKCFAFLLVSHHPIMSFLAPQCTNVFIEMRPVREIKRLRRLILSFIDFCTLYQYHTTAAKKKIIHQKWGGGVPSSVTKKKMKHNVNEGRKEGRKDNRLFNLSTKS